MTFVVLPVVAWEATGSAATFGLIMAGGAVGMLIAMPFGGVLADRVDRRRIMLVGDAVQVVLMLAMLVAVEHEAWWSLPFIELACTFVGSLFASAGPALRRDALPDELRTEGNALFSVATSSANLLGPVLGGTIYALAGFATVIAVDILTFVASFVLLLGLRMETRPPASGEAVVGLSDVTRRTIADIRSGLALATHDPFLRRSFGAALACGFGNGLVLVAIVPWFDVTLGLPPSWWGIAMATMGGAGVAGGLVVARIGERVALHRLLIAGSVTFAAGSLLLVVVSTPVGLIVGFALIGCTNAAFSVAVSTGTQRRVAASHQGRINSLSMCSFQISQLTATLIGVAVVDAVSPEVTMQAAVAAFVVGAVAYARAGRALARTAPRFSEDELALGA